MNGDKTVVTVRIAGEEYTLRSEASPDYAHECAEYADRTIARVIEQGSLVEAHKAAILAALALTDELFQARAEADELRETVARMAGRLVAEIDEATAS
ncbi:MAG: cell division protein ZapA [Gemmatimonadota bacterium]